MRATSDMHPYDAEIVELLKRDCLRHAKQQVLIDLVDCGISWDIITPVSDLYEGEADLHQMLAALEATTKDALFRDKIRPAQMQLSL